MQSQSIIPKSITEYDLRLLRIFKVVVENGGFSAAESELGVTRSTISVHMSNLEARMKLKLCLRGRGGFSLTEEGQAVYHAVLHMFDSLNDFSLLVSSLGKELSGELVILCSDPLDDIKQQKMAKVIEKINDQAPSLHLVLDTDSIANIEKQLLKDKAHIALFPNYKPVEGLHYQTLLSEPIYLCCAKNHLFFQQVDHKISAEDLAAAPAVHPGIDIDAKGREQLTKLNLAAKAYQFDTRKAMILSGRYIGYLPQSTIQQELNLGEIRIIQPSSLTYQFDLSLVYKKSAKESAKVELLSKAFIEVF
ncbi:MAG: LysR family transcriptional regulator [Colwellia sp.]